MNANPQTDKSNMFIHNHLHRHKAHFTYTSAYIYIYQFEGMPGSTCFGLLCKQVLWLCNLATWSTLSMAVQMLIYIHAYISCMFVLKRRPEANTAGATFVLFTSLLVFICASFSLQSIVSCRQNSMITIKCGYPFVGRGLCVVWL